MTELDNHIKRLKGLRADASIDLHGAIDAVLEGLDTARKVWALYDAIDADRSK